ncbi:MAG: threonine ammonia-lyase, biosynthetic [Deltaproteobacteria bacterium]|jgi:threonine dehydratase|nr:threonine ammonia-lyase, biosynthetic [Deltaproteobacteria bacterium]
MQSLIKKILNARVYDVAVKSPLEPMPRLSARLNNNIYLKREDLQPVFSFKLRGAYNRMSRLTDAEKIVGVICASAGNHAQGVSLAAQRMGLRALIVMPHCTPPIKIQAVKRLGGEVLLHGEAFDDAYARARELEKELGLTFIHPFDDEDVIAGQGTIAMELFEQHPDLNAIFVPVGGGGLAAGIAAYAKFLRPDVKVIGVEPVDAASMHDSLAAGKRLALPRVGVFADGVAVREPGLLTFELCGALLDEIILVNTDEICAAIKDIFNNNRAIAEPAGALAAAGAKKYLTREKLCGLDVVAVNSGANINFDRLRHVAERAEIGEAHEALFAVTIPEEPGAYKRLINTLGDRYVTEFNYRYSNAGQAHIFIGLQTAGGLAEQDGIQIMLRDNGYTVSNLSDNEIAKLHIRYMVGGNAPGLRNERLFHFEFPEHQGALLKFLDSLSTAWNISLFHYRNHGSDYGRVLCGLQAPQEDNQILVAALDKLGYAYREETHNPAYRFFLGCNPPSLRGSRFK